MENYLKVILNQVDTVLFVGSGLSQWSGLPSWGGLIRELAAFLGQRGIDSTIVEAEATRGDFLQAASYGFDRLSPAQIGEFMRHACRLATAKPHGIHQKVVTLGPRCFLTTNYDHLLERSFQQWQPDRYIRVVNNRQLTETADIIQARSIDFLFKVHGDAADEESIILTREQYRTLLPDGERHHALETARILLASRPVVYLGFGLRDPDFLYVRDLLANTFKGGSRDHYAVMADVTAPEIDYWRRNYGIHLLPYKTSERPDGVRDHTELLHLLERLVPSATRAVSDDTSTAVPKDELVVLRLMRHAARLSRFDKREIEFPLRVSYQDIQQSLRFSDADWFNGQRVEKLLDAGPKSLILVGLPGAGKTYALRSSSARFAERLYTYCLEGHTTSNVTMVPIFVDLKLYEGKLSVLVEKALPASLTLTELGSNFHLKIYLDAFNEMPSDYIESGSWEADFSAFLSTVPSASVILASRTKDVLGKLGYPTYFLDELDRDFVVDTLVSMGIPVARRSDDLLRVLQKPFFFNLIKNGTVTLSRGHQPRDLYAALFETLASDFEARFGARFDLEEALSLAAYEAVDGGEEALGTAEVVNLLSRLLDASGLKIDSEDLINWLIGKHLLIPYSGARIAFSHQSVTEFLAARELARRYLKTPHILQEKLRWRRWDQALFLTLTFLPADAAKTFIDEIVRIDFALSAAAVRYVENGAESIVLSLLERVPKQEAGLHPYESRLEGALSNLPLTSVHAEPLRRIVSMGNSVGGAAATCLFRIGGPDARAELLQYLRSRFDDYNFCQPIGRVLAPTISEADLPLLVSLADDLQESEGAVVEGKCDGFISAVGRMVASLPPRKTYEAFYDPARPMAAQRIHLAILNAMAFNQDSSDALELAGELLLRGDNKSITSINFIMGYGEPRAHLNFDGFDERHLRRCISLLKDNEWGRWALTALKRMCLIKADYRQTVCELATRERGVMKAYFMSACAKDEESSVFAALSDILTLSGDELQEQPFEALASLEVNWVGNEDLFVSLLRLRYVPLAKGILESVYAMPEKLMGNLKIGQIQWWLDWLHEFREDPDWVFSDRLAYALAVYVGTQTKAEYVAEFNNVHSPYRHLLAKAILPKLGGLTTDELNADAISFLLANISKLNLGMLLGNVATESFALERLLPLLPSARGSERRNLLRALRNAGKRHGRRYNPE